MAGDRRDYMRLFDGLNVVRLLYDFKSPLGADRGLIVNN